MITRASGRRQNGSMTAALCPGSFDPPTNGHLDVINRAVEMFDRVIVGVVHNPSKTPFFSIEERVAMLEEMVGGRAEVQAFEGLLVEFARSKGVDVVVKGLRAVSDFDYELQMAQMNYTLSSMETLFIPTNPLWSYLSSSLVREVALLGGDVDTLVPDNVGAREIFFVFSRFHLMLEWVGELEESINDAGQTTSAFQPVISPGFRAAVINEEKLQVVVGAAAPIGLNRQADNYGALLYLSIEHKLF